MVLTQSEVKDLLDYCPETGILTWKPRPWLEGKASAWNKQNAGRSILGVNGHGYIQLSIHKKRYEAHRIIWMIVYGVFPTLNLDHINGIKTDNRINNLREASVSQNAWNVKQRPKQGARKHSQANRWYSTISLNGKIKYLGIFKTETEALVAYRAAVQLYRGEFAGRE